MAEYIFIVGAGRSGTKVLRDCLGASARVACIPYDIGYVWSRGSESLQHDELKADGISARQRHYIRETICRFGRKAARGMEFDIVIEKSVPNSLRPLYVKTVFPEAKLIHIVRDGRCVIESAMRNWDSPSDKGYFIDKLRYFPLRSIPYALWYAKNKINFGSKSAKLWGPRYKGMQCDANEKQLIEVCTQQWIRCVETCEKQLLQMPSSDVLQIRYEDFIDDPATLKRICSFANIRVEGEVEHFYARYVEPYKGNACVDSLSQDQLMFIERQAAVVLARYGYT